MHERVYVCVCNHSIGRNFYPIDTKFGTQVKIHVKFEDVVFIEIPRGHRQKLKYE